MDTTILTEGMMADSPVMVAFPLVESGEVENMHARRLPNGDYVLDNIPFYAYDISYGDEFSATHVSGRLLFDKVKRRGGYSTYRIKLQPGATHDEFLVRWPSAERTGCEYEGSGLGEHRLYAIDVPPGADVETVYAWLAQGEQEGFWDFEEGHYAGSLKAGSN